MAFILRERCLVLIPDTSSVFMDIRSHSALTLVLPWRRRFSQAQTRSQESTLRQRYLGWHSEYKVRCLNAVIYMQARCLNSHTITIMGSICLNVASRAELNY